MATHLASSCLVEAEGRCGGLRTWAARGGAQAFPEPGTPPSFAPDRGFDVDRIDLDLTVAPERGELAGVALIHVRPLPAGLGPVALDLDDVTVDAVEAEADGAAVADLRWRYGDGRLVVQGLPPPGGVVRVRYHGRPVRGMYFTGPTAAHPDRQPMAWTQCQDEDGHYIFPCLDAPGIKHPWRITVRVDAPEAEAWTVVGNGHLAARDGAAWTWHQDEPIPAYLVTVVVGRMVVVEDEPVAAEPGRSVPVRYVVPAIDVSGQPADEAQVRRVFGRTPAMIAFLGQQLGTPYPWPRYDQVIVHDFIFGGMENAAATTLTDLMLTDARAALDNDYDDLVVHELMHQWFGDLVTCQDWSQGWLNEGWATYSESLWKDHAESADEADLHRWDAMAAYLDEDGSRYRRAIVSYRFRQAIDVFDRHLYQKASLVLHTLRGELGEAAFWAGVRDYLALHRYAPVHTRDFQRALERTSGRNLDRFFRERILGAGHPQLEVKLAHEDGLLTVQVEQKQAAGPVAEDPEHVVAEAFELVLPLVIVQGDARTAVRLRLRERKHGFAFPCAEAPDRVEVDARFSTLAEVTVKAPRDWLVGSLRRDDGVVGRIRAARALVEDGSPQAIAAVAAALATEPCWGVRAELATLLGKHGDGAARQALLGALADPHPKARRAVVSALTGLRHPDVAAALARLARDGDPSVQVEGAALVAVGQQVRLGDVGESSAEARHPGLAADDALALLREAVHRESWVDLLTQRALDGLSRTRRAEVLDVLVEHTGAAHPERVRAAAAQGLGRLAGEVDAVRRPAVDRLVELARDPTWRVRYFALSALGGARDPRALGVLHEVHSTALEGRLRRTAWEASRQLAKAAEDPVAALRDELEKLREESQKLRGRVEELEARAKAGEAAG